MNSVILLLLPMLLGAQPSPEALTQQVLELWRSSKYDAIYAMFDEQMRKAISLEQYRQGSEEVKSLGEIKVSGAPKPRGRARMWLSQFRSKPVRRPSIFA